MMHATVQRWRPIHAAIQGSADLSALARGIGSLDVNKLPKPLIH
jgi:hypothetical protein